MSDIKDRLGIQPQVRDEFALRDAAMSGDIAINIITDDVAPAPTAAAWEYVVAFEIVNAAGDRHTWFSADITAAAADTSTAGTASVSDTTPAVVNGYGTVTLSGDAADWLDTETATCTLDATILGKDLTDAVFTVTFTAE